jgi:hypothetical protein
MLPRGRVPDTPAVSGRQSTSGLWPSPLSLDGRVLHVFSTMGRRPQLNKTIPSDPGRSYVIHIKDFTPLVSFDSGTKLASQTMVRELFNNCRKLGKTLTNTARGGLSQ